MDLTCSQRTSKSTWSFFVNYYWFSSFSSTTVMTFNEPQSKNMFLAACQTQSCQVYYNQINNTVNFDYVLIVTISFSAVDQSPSNTRHSRSIHKTVLDVLISESSYPPKKLAPPLGFTLMFTKAFISSTSRSLLTVTIAWWGLVSGVLWVWHWPLYDCTTPNSEPGLGRVPRDDLFLPPSASSAHVQCHFHFLARCPFSFITK